MAAGMAALVSSNEVESRETAGRSFGLAVQKSGMKGTGVLLESRNGTLATQLTAVVLTGAGWRGMLAEIRLGECGGVLVPALARAS